MGKTAASVIGAVAAVAIAVVAPMLAPLALGFLGIAATTTAIAIATAVIGLTLSVGLSLAFSALGVGAPSAKNQVGPPQVFRQSISNSFIVYGQRRVGGLLVFFHAKQVGSEHFRYFVIACAGHRCLDVITWMLNDEEVSVDVTGHVFTGKYAQDAWLWFDRGETPSTANATFVSECDGNWTSNHRGDGIAKIYAKFRMSDTAVQAGMPNITAVIRGRDEIYDPRSLTTGYSRTASLIFYDWMQISREEGGFGAYTDEIPDDVWQSAQANVCDEAASDGAARYRLDAVITTGAPPSEIRDSMIVNMAGSYTFSGGKHLMRPGYWVPISETLSEDDLAGGIQVSPFSTADQAVNEVQGTFINPEDNYQGAPFTTQSVASSDVRQVDLDLAFTTHRYQAERVARIMLNRAQYEKTVVWPMNIAGVKTRALDTVALDSTRYGLNNYAWQVVNWGLSADWGVVLTLREESEDIYVEPATTTPATPPTVVGGSPVLTLAETQSILRGTYPVGLVVDAIDAGSNATIRLHGTSGTSSTFVLDYPGTYASVTVPAGTVTGLAYSTLYYLYADVDNVGDATPTYGATTSYANSLNSSTFPFRISLNRTVTTPAALGGTTTGTGTGGGYGGGYGTNIP